jgi:hypothetical protein
LRHEETSNERNISMTDQPHKAFIATVHLLIEANSEAEACDIVSALLSENGTHNKDTGLIDWSYIAHKSDFASPVETIVPDGYIGIDLQLDIIAERARGQT